MYHGAATARNATANPAARRTRSPFGKSSMISENGASTSPRYFADAHAPASAPQIAPVATARRPDGSNAGAHSAATAHIATGTSMYDDGAIHNHSADPVINAKQHAPEPGCNSFAVGAAPAASAPPRPSVHSAEPADPAIAYAGSDADSASHGKADWAIFGSNESVPCASAAYISGK